MREDVGCLEAPFRRVGQAPTSDEFRAVCNPKRLDQMVRSSLAGSLWTLAVVVAPLAIGCGQRSSPASLISGGSDTSGHEMPVATSCSTPQEGCPCETEAEAADCGVTLRHSEGYTACSIGTRVCTDGQWGACEGDKIAMLPDPAPGVQTQGLGTTKACVDNPCDPFCQIIVDDSKDLDLTTSPGLTAGNNGLMLTVVPPSAAANPCTGIKLDPPTQTLTVTTINPTTGLLGEYFNQRDKNVTTSPAPWPITATRIDASAA